MVAELTIEGKEAFPVRDFAKVESELRKLRTPGPRSFAILARPDGSYIQVAGGRVTCVVERRDVNSVRNFRARLAEPKVPFKGVTTLVFGSGTVEAHPEEFLFIEDVIPLFKSFFDNKEPDVGVTWQELDESFRATTDAKAD
ncbi:MAG: hypothetical protein ACU0GG_00605 [Paracoccaceae bacterium]